MSDRVRVSGRLAVNLVGSQVCDGLLDVSDKVRVSSRPAPNPVCSLGAGECSLEGADEGEIGGSEGVLLLEYPQQRDGICRTRLTAC